MDPSSSSSLQEHILTVEKDDPWLADGNVVFSCERMARFRVHASLLARHSEVFHNLFADAEPRTAAAGCPVVEGCPVIELSDTKEDCRNLLLALYGPVSFKMRNVDDFLHLSSILRSATKYCVDWLRNKAIAYLSRTWPHTLQEWINVPEDLKGDPIPHPALVINLARKVDAPIFLPLALYRLGRLSIAQAHEVELTSSMGPIPPSLRNLSPEDLMNHLRYRENERISARRFVRDILGELQPVALCGNNVACLESLESVISDLESYFVRCDHAPIGFMEQALEYEPEDALCSVCQQNLRAVIEDETQNLWSELPSWFGLPEWDILTVGFPRDEI